MQQNNLIKKNISPKTREELVTFWKNPTRLNRPDFYVHGNERSKILVKLVKNYAKKDMAILEIGCNVGRNLYFLYLAGFRNLHGVELNTDAIYLLKQTYPQLAKSVKLYNIEVEKIIKKFETNQFDVVFTTAVLEHIHPDSVWIFPHISRIAKSILITIENEMHRHWRSFPRNYKRIFETFNLKQATQYNCEKIEGLGPTYFARVFKKKHNS